MTAIEPMVTLATLLHVVVYSSHLNICSFKKSRQQSFATCSI